MSLTLVRISGVTSALFVMMLVMNYILKLGNQLVVYKLPGGPAADAYRACMRFVVRQHRKLALFFCIGVMVHVFLSVSFGRIRLSGLAMLAVLLWTALIGLYGYHVSRNPRGGWFPFHRLGVATLVWLLILHIINR